MATPTILDARLSSLIDHLYAAAMDPSLWPGTATLIAEAMQSTSAVVKLHTDGGEVSLLERTGNLVVSEADRAWAEDWHRRDLWVERSVQHGMGRVITDADLVTVEEQRCSGFYQEWLRHLDIHHLLGAVFPAGPGTVAVQVAGAIGDYRSGDTIWCERIGPDDFARAMNRDVLVPRAAGRFGWGRLIGREEARLLLLPPGPGARQQVVADPPWIARAVRLVRAL